MSETVAKARWAAAIAAYDTQTRCHLLEAVVVLAATYDEARGKALRIAEELWPDREGHANHAVNVRPTDEADDPEDVRDEGTRLGQARLEYVESYDPPNPDARFVVELPREALALLEALSRGVKAP